MAHRTFNCPVDAIGESTVASDVAGWDSLSQTIFILNLEAAFGVEFELDRIYALNNVGDLVTALQARAA